MPVPVFLQSGLFSHENSLGHAARVYGTQGAVELWQQVMSPSDKYNEPWLKQVGAILSLGFALAICIVGGFAAGFFFDQWAGTSPIGLLVGLFAGIGGGVYQSYRLIMKFIK